MRDASYVIAAVMIGTLVVTWTLGRIIKRIHDRLALVGGLVLRVGVGVVVALVAAQAAIHGGYWLILVPVLGLLTLFEFAMTAGIVWAWARYGLDDIA